MKTRWKIFWVVVLILIAIRVALPFVIQAQVNKKLASMPEYTGHVDGVRLSLFQGAFRLVGLHLQDKAHSSSVFIPFLGVRIAWLPLFHKQVIATATVRDPRVDVTLPQLTNEMKAEKAKQPQPQKPQKPLSETLREMLPFRVDGFTLENGIVKVEDTRTKPPQVVYLKDIDLAVHNLTNSPIVAETMRAHADLSFVVNESGKGQVHMQFNPTAQQPTFGLHAQLTDVHIPDLNPLLRNKTGLKADNGTLALVTEDAAADGAFKGYVKPVITNLQIGNPSKGKPLKSIESAVAGAATKLLENSKNQVAAKVPIQGKFQDPHMSLVDATVSVLDNALTSSIVPKLEGKPTLNKVKQQAPEIKKNS